jgi:hypothetical protein
MKVTVKACQENMKVAIKFIRSELKEIIKSQVEGVWMSVDQGMQGLGEELNAKIEEKQLGKQTAPT